jgi:hypothetical protein
VANIHNTQLTLGGTANDIQRLWWDTKPDYNIVGRSDGLPRVVQLTGTSGNVLQTGGDSVLYGTYLATHGGQFECAQLNLTGALINIGDNVHLVSGPSMTFAPFTFSD